jgi:hypothetical protein
MLRVRRITVSPPPGTSGGAVDVPGAGVDLDAFDLVVVYGPNGAGKSLLTKPLREPPGGLVLIAPDGAERLIDRKNPLGFDRGLLCRTSVDLLTEFTSLKTALGKAAGITRYADEKRILEKLVAPRGQGSLAALRPVAGQTVPLATRQAMDDFRQAERLTVESVGPELPLSLAAYNSLGRQVGQIMGRHWPQQTIIDAAAMRAAEEAVRPAAVVIRGSGDLAGACDAAQARLGGPDASLAVAVERAERRLAAAVAAAAEVLPLPAGEPPPALDAWPERCRAAAVAARARVDEHEKLIRSLDAVTQLRQQAIAVVAHGGQDKCPVCAGAIEPDALLDALGQAVAAAAPGLADLQRQMAAHRETARRLDAAADEVERGRRDSAEQGRAAATVIGRCHDALVKLGEAAAARTEWDDRVRAIAERLRTSATDARQAIDNAADSPLAARLGIVATAVATARESAAAAARAIDALGITVNGGLGEAGRLFNQAVRLRELLVCRQAFNAQSWEPSWERARDDEARNLLVDAWTQAVDGLLQDRRQRLENAERGILGEPAVQERFRGLIAGLHHPVLAGVDLAADAVVRGGDVLVGGSRKASPLSEGFTVLVNLAAFVAVAGYVAEGQEHEPGWVIIDEPTNGLDPQHAGLVADYLGGLDTTAMPRQIFVTTYDDDFRRRLIAAGCGSGRRTLELRLPPWRGGVSAPEIIDHRRAAS